MNNPNNSSDEEEINLSSDDDNNSYGAYGKRRNKRKANNNGMNDKERNLYGIFYEDDSDNDNYRNRGYKGSGYGGRKKARKYDKQSNRLAGLSFVKAGEDKKNTNDIADDKGDVKDDNNKVDEEEPSWLKEKPKSNTAHDVNKNQPSSKQSTTNDTKNNNTTPKQNDNDMEISDDENEEEIKLLQQQQEKFNKLLNVVNTSNNPLQQQQKQKKPVKLQSTNVNSNVGVDSSIEGMGVGGGIGFSREREGGGQSCSVAQSAGLGFASSSNTSNGGQDEKPFISGGVGMSTSGLGHQLGGIDSSSAAAGIGSQGGGLGLGHHSSQSNEQFLIGRGRGSSVPSSNQGGLSGLGLGASSSNMGGGLGSSNNNSNYPMSGGGLGLRASNNNFQQSQFTKPKRKDPNLGKWEKHTKGIGMKLLQKMGYEGSGGLGAKKVKKKRAAAASTDDNDQKNTTTNQSAAAAQPPSDEQQGETETQIKKGISRPVEVVVRPNGLGLGFGNFKEQSQLKVNRQIEAEVRGIELPKEDKDNEDKKKKGIFDGIDESLLPSTASLLDNTSGSWRKGGGKGKKKKKRKIINYQDILDQQTTTKQEDDGKMKIIDMRGTATSSTDMRDVPSGSTNNSAITTEVPIGEELLHNVTLLLNTHKGQLRTASYMVQSTKSKISTLEKEVNEMKERREVIKQRSTKMKLALRVIDQAEDIIDKLSVVMKDIGHIERLDYGMNALQGLFHNLYNNFSREERKALKFDSTLIPSIIKPILDALTSSLNPLTMTDFPSWMDQLTNGIQTLCNEVGTINEKYVLREMIYMQSIVPWVQSALNSSRWDVTIQVEAGLGVYEHIIKSVSTSLQDAEEEENNMLKEDITDELVQSAVLPKLVRAVSQWRPKLNDNGHQQQQGQQQVVNPLHLWILPWLPYIANNSILGGLLDDVRRNLKKTLSFLSKSISNDIEFIRCCMTTLSPWIRLFDESSVFELTSNSVTPRFARSLARVKVEIDSSRQDWEHLNVLFEYFDKGLMSSNDFISLIEGEVLSSYVYTLYSTLKYKNSTLQDVKKFYMAWKEHIFVQPTKNQTSTSNSAHLKLQSDPMICRYFYGGLKMIQAAIESNNTLLDSLQPAHPTDCNYRIALMHRSATNNENVKPARGTNVRVQQKTQLPPTGSRTEASFKEVVESFCHQHDISFRPKSNSMKDGKPIFLFGDHPVYLDKNVIYTLRANVWQPISLEHLAASV